MVIREREMNVCVYLTAAPDSRPNIFRVSEVDFKRISYICFASKYPIPENKMQVIIYL